MEPQDELAQVHSPADLALLMNESAAHGLLDESDHGLLARTLSLRNVHAEQAMTPRRDIVSVEPTADGRTIERIARETGRSRLLITDADGEYDGVVHVKDALVLGDEALARTTAEDLRRPISTVVPSRDVESVMQDLRTSGSHIVLVIDEYGSSIGMLTLEDILEEIIGDFADESDEDEVLASIAEEDGTVVVPGGWRIDEVARRVSLALPDGDYQTLAGYVLHELGRIPVVGDQIATADGDVLVVRGMDGTRITRVAVTAAA